MAHLQGGFRPVSSNAGYKLICPTISRKNTLAFNIKIKTCPGAKVYRHVKTKGLAPWMARGVSLVNHAHHLLFEILVAILCCLSGSESLKCPSISRVWAVSSAVEHLLDTQGVTSSILVPPTIFSFITLH